MKAIQGWYALLFLLVMLAALTAVERFGSQRNDIMGYDVPVPSVAYVNNWLNRYDGRATAVTIQGQVTIDCARTSPHVVFTNCTSTEPTR